jgi:hypothetical protein
MHDVLRIPSFEYAQTLSGIHHFSVRMTLLPLSAGKCALVSPIPIDDTMASAIAAYGEVQYLIAPNLLHHLYVAAARERYPNARLLAPPALTQKRPDLRIDFTLDRQLPEELSSQVAVQRIEGAQAIDEYALFHRASRTLVVTDLVFNVVRPRGWFAHLVQFVVGCHGRLAQSRVWRFLVRDREATARSIEQLLALPFETLIVAHGEVIHEDARARLAGALSRWARANLALPLPH